MHKLCVCVCGGGVLICFRFQNVKTYANIASCTNV